MPEFIQTFKDRSPGGHSPNLSPSLFRILRNDAHPWVEALKSQLPLAAKRPRKECSLRGIRKISVSGNDGEFTSVQFYGTGRNCCLNPESII
jgi:hypothetical protein